MGRRKVINQPIFKQEDLYNLNSAEYGFGEIVVSHESGHEGLYVLNNMGNKFIKVATNLSTASSAVTQEDLDQLQIEINSLAHNVTNNYYTKEQTEEKISEIISGYSEFFIDENAVRAIVNGEIDKLVDSAVTEYNTIGKISRWIENSSGYDFTEIYEEISGITQSVDSIDDRLVHVENVISGVSKTTDHFVMTYDQYQELITSGSVYVEGYDIITYSDDHFYCIYEEETPQPTPTPSSGTAIMSGDTVIFDENYPYEDGEAPSLYIGEITDEGGGVISVDWFTNDSGDEESSGDVDGDTVTINDTLYDSNEPLNIGTIENGDDDGVVSVPWEI